MNERELREAADCAVCGKGIGHAGLPLFWRLKIERFGVDMNALRRQSGLETFLGSVALAQIMGPGEDMAKSLMEPVEITVCEPCALESITLAHLAEMGVDEKPTKERSPT